MFQKKVDPFGPKKKGTHPRWTSRARTRRAAARRWFESHGGPTISSGSLPHGKPRRRQDPGVSVLWMSILGGSLFLDKKGPFLKHSVGPLCGVSGAQPANLALSTHNRSWSRQFPKWGSFKQGPNAKVSAPWPQAIAFAEHCGLFWRTFFDRCAVPISLPCPRVVLRSTNARTVLHGNPVQR